MRLPWDLEQVTLWTELSVRECSERLAGATLRWHRAPCPAVFPVRGYILERRFYLGRSGSPQTPPRTCVRGHLLSAGSSTRVDLTIGPNPLLGFVLLITFAMLISGALILSWIALKTDLFSVRLAAVSWVVVAAYGGLFFLAPSFDYARERRYLIAFVERTLDAMVDLNRPSRTRAS